MHTRNGDSLPRDDAGQGARHDPGRREFVKKAAYLPPAIITLKTAPAYAKKGSDKKPKKR